MNTVKFNMGVFFLALAMASQAIGECQEMTLAALKAQKETPIQLVFFASWCLSCKDHLEALKSAKNTYFIASYDRKDKAEDVLKFLNMEKVPCIYDKGNTFSEYFGVNELPAIKTLSKAE